MFKINKKSIVFGIVILAILVVGIIFPAKVNAYTYNNWPAPTYGNDTSSYYTGTDNSAYNNNYSSYYGYGYNGNLYGYNNAPNPIPVVYSITPNSVSGVGGNIAVTINGANFAHGAMAEFNSNYRSTSYIDQNHLTVVLDAKDAATPGSYVISVFNPQPGGGNSNGVFFVVNPSANNVVVASASKSNSKSSTVAKTSNKESSNLAANALFGSNSFIPSSLIQWLLFLILILLLIVLWRKLVINDIERPLKHL